MAEFNLTEGSGRPAGHMPTRRGVLYKKLDFSKTGYSASDILNLFNVKDMLVERMAIRVITPEGGAATAGAGDGANATGFLAAVDLNAAGTTITTLALTEGAPNTVANYSNGKAYIAADTLDLTLNNNVSTAVIEIFAPYTMLV